jgi:UDP-glucose 4-epimerase
MNQIKSVLVTGAAGFIGRAAVTSLEQAGWIVTKAVRTGDQFRGSGYIILDLANPATILSMANEAHFDAIVHLGANVNLLCVDGLEMFAPNTLATGCLAYLAKQWNAQLIYASTAIVCGAKKEAIDATSIVAVDTAYAQSKWLGEQLLVASYAHHCTLRIGGVFGANGPVHLGVNRAIAEAINGVVPTQIGCGGALRNYIYVKDVASAIAIALQERLNGTHLLAGSEVKSVSQMLQEICNTFLQGQQPAIVNGQEAMNQVIQPSPYLPRTRGFCEALNDIKTAH